MAKNKVASSGFGLCAPCSGGGRVGREICESCDGSGQHAAPAGNPNVVSPAPKPKKKK